MQLSKPIAIVLALVLVLGTLLVVLSPDGGRSISEGASQQAELGQVDQPTPLVAIGGSTVEDDSPSRSKVELEVPDAERRRLLRVMRPDGSLLTSGVIEFVELERGHRNAFFVQALESPALIDFGSYSAIATEHSIPANGLIDLPAGGIAFATAREGSLAGAIALDFIEFVDGDVATLELVEQGFCEVRVLRTDGTPAPGVVVELQRCDLKELARAEKSGRDSARVWNRMVSSNPTDEHGRTQIQCSFPTSLLERHQLLEEGSRVRLICTLGYANPPSAEFVLNSQEEVVFTLPPAGHVELVLEGYPTDAAPILRFSDSMQVRPNKPVEQGVEGLVYRFENIPLAPELSVEMGRWNEQQPLQRRSMRPAAYEPHLVPGPQADNETVRAVLRPSIQGCFHGRLVELTGLPFQQAPERSWQTVMIAKLRDQSTVELAFESLADGHFLARLKSSGGRHAPEFGDVAELFMVQVPNMPGYSAPQLPLHGSWARVLVDAMDDAESVDLGVIQLGQDSPILEWRVMGQDGEPIEGARVAIFERNGKDWNDNPKWEHRLQRGPHMCGPDGRILIAGFALDDALQRNGVADDVYRIEVSHEDFVPMTKLVHGLSPVERFELESASRIHGSFVVPPWVREVRVRAEKPGLDEESWQQLHTRVWAAQDSDPDGGQVVLRPFELGPLADDPVDLVIEFETWPSHPLLRVPGVIPGAALDSRLQEIDLANLTDLFELEIFDLEGERLDEPRFRKLGLRFQLTQNTERNRDSLFPRWEEQRAQLCIPTGVKPEIWLAGPGIRAVDLIELQPGRHSIHLEEQPVIRGRILGKEQLPAGWSVSVDLAEGAFRSRIETIDDPFHDLAFAPQFPHTYFLRWKCVHESRVGRSNQPEWTEPLVLSESDLRGANVLEFVIPQELIAKVRALDSQD
jgi:hypothetical protein